MELRTNNNTQVTFDFLKSVTCDNVNVVSF